MKKAVAFAVGTMLSQFAPVAAFAQDQSIENAPPEEGVILVTAQRRQEDDARGFAAGDRKHTHRAAQ